MDHVEEPPGAPTRLPGVRGLAMRVYARVGRFLPLLRTVGFVVAVGIVVAMGVGAAGDVHLDQLTWWPLGIGVLAATLWWVLLGRGWVLLLAGGLNRADFSSWCRTQALRYLPGGIWAPVSRGAIMHGSSLDRLSTVAAENVVSLCAAVALGGVALAATGKLAWSPLILAAAVPLIASRFTASRSRIAPQRTSRATLNYLVAFAGYMVAAVLVQAAISGWHDLATVAGAACLSWAAGLVVVIAPSGVGAREWVYVELLKGPIGHADLVAGALTLRVVTIVAELAVLVIAGRPARAPADSKSR
jgi:glycosyltransferase 2 family protein